MDLVVDRALNCVEEAVKNSSFEFKLEGWQAVAAVIGLGICVAGAVVGCKLADGCSEKLVNRLVMNNI